MHYFEVLVGDMQYHGQDALTYSYNAAIPVGSVVRVSLRHRPALGIVSRMVRKPGFTVKPIGYYDPSSQSLPATSLALLEWMRHYYPAPLGAIVRQFLPPTTATAKQTTGDSEPEIKQLPMLASLTTEQQTVLKQVAPAGLSLLHGVTGSGKTRVYIELAKECLSSGKSTILLTPEIGLTAQLVESFSSQFPGKAMVLHSQLTTATRRNLWYQALNSTDPLVIIGPRSALFAPLSNIGLIVIDESHETAYKNETTPHYLSSRVAAKLAELHNAKLVIGSATPLVEDIYVASQKHRPILRMTKPATQVFNDKARTLVVDLKNRDEFPRSRTISQTLQRAIEEALSRKEQSLIYLNRRGTAKVILCSTCGWQQSCPHCDLPLTYHGDEHRLRCHVCGYRQAFPTSCPGCGNTDILLRSVGTKAIVDELRKLFPGAIIQRFDTDSTRQERLEQNLSALKAGNVDIIVGTQIVAKGLDLPWLAVVGVINADTSLYLPDFTASERTFQLLSQVVGRVGRGHRPGTAVVQTYSPKNPVIQAAIHGEWDTFYDRELAERQQYVFPPFCYLLKLVCTRASSKSAEKSSQTLADLIRKRHPRVTIEGPSPAFHLRHQNKYRWQIILKASRRSELLAIVSELPAGWVYDIDPTNLL